VSVTTASASRIDGTKTRNLSRATLSGGQVGQTITAGWSTNGGTNYSVTGPGIVVATFGVTTLTLDGVSKVTTDANGLVYMPFASTAVITGTAHGIYTSRYASSIAIPTSAVKTSTAVTHTYGGSNASNSYSVTTSSGFLWAVVVTGSISGGTDAYGSLGWAVRHNGTSTGGSDRTLYGSGAYRSQGSGGGQGIGSHWEGMMFPFDGTLKLASSWDSQQNASASITLTAIWSATLPAT
jgi:hypothetical protein